MNRTEIQDALIEHFRTGTIPVVFVTGEAGNVGAVEALYPWIQLMRELASEAPTKKTKQLVTDLARAWIKFVPIVGDVIESTVEIISIVREHRLANAAAEPPVSREHIFHQCVGFFCALAEKGRVVIMIDDAHWADDSSLNLLFALARASEGNITCVVAYRPDDVRTSNQGGEHTILHIRRELERYDLCQEIIFPPMNAAELQAVLGDVSVSIPNVHRFSGGNPFLAQGYVHVENGPHSKTSFNAVIAEKLRRLDADQRDLLLMAAVEGETFTSLVLRDVSPLPPLRIALVLRKAEQDHMIIRSLGKKEWYVSETQTIELAVDHQNIMAKLAVHAERAGDALEAVSSWLAVADHAWKLYAEQEAHNAIAQALRVCTPVRATRSVQVLHGKVLCLRGVIEQFVGNVSGALASYKQAMELARETGDASQHVIALCRASAASSLGGDRGAGVFLCYRGITHLKGNCLQRRRTCSSINVGYVE